MLQQGPTEGIHIRVGVLDFAHLPQNPRNRGEALSRQVANVIVLDVPVGETLQVHESRVGISENSVAISWDDSPRP